MQLHVLLTVVHAWMCASTCKKVHMYVCMIVGAGVCVCVCVSIVTLTSLLLLIFSILVLSNFKYIHVVGVIDDKTVCAP